MKTTGWRRNLALAQSESWRPPLFQAEQSARTGLVASVRRFLDLQAGSVWNDLKPLLAQATGTVVDVGCGAQPYRSLLPPEVCYIGIDSEEAAAHFGYRSPDTRYFTGSRWPVETGAADIVLCSETLEHVLDPHEFLLEARRCLKPGGKLLLTVPFAARWHFIPHDYWRFTPSALNHLLERAAFCEVFVTARGNAVTVACYKVMALIVARLLPQSGHGLSRLFQRLVGAALAPLLLVLAIIANLSLSCEGGDDCLGYTVLCSRGPEPQGEAPGSAFRPAVMGAAEP